MSKYTIISNPGGYSILDNETGLFFSGYDFMGSVDWSDDEYTTGIEEAQQIISDLKAADDPAETETPDQDQVRIVIEAAQNWLDHLNYRGISDDALWNAIKAMKAEI